MAKIGIMGGTFNPIHNVHLIMAEEARRQFQLDKVLFMPSKNPPHKERQDIVSDEHRKRMIQHAIQDNPYFKFSDIELKRKGTTYTRDTLAYLKENYPEDSFYFILGGDSLATLESWKEPEFVFRNCHILAANRDNVTDHEIPRWIQHFSKKYDAQISEIKMPAISISSEMLRKKIAKNISVSNYCPTSVEWYIKIHHLYGFSGEYLQHKEATPKEIKNYLMACLKPSRFSHTLGVAMTAANLASVHGYDSKDAYLAGLLHDCAKYLTGKEQIRECEEAGIPLTEVEKSNTALIHGKLGAHFANIKYGITDKEILSAITYHTTGHPNMTLLEKIIYLADYMEPQRDMKCKPYSLTEIRKMCFRDLEKALCMVLENTVKYLDKSGNVIDEMTQKTYEWYKKE